MQDKRQARKKTKNKEKSRRKMEGQKGKRLRKRNSD